LTENATMVKRLDGTYRGRERGYKGGMNLVRARTGDIDLLISLSNRT